ncbi:MULTISPECIES: DnaJ C-terminal domain-containing protein [unclassified Rhizobium]|uniref:DnaJ C-terminal domain-containing protein n=1 Tax=unclassified Rhizobium TaxID=2613769 RepID=UPI00247919D8|nr:MULTISPECIES: DnaJ C-terminal domain-containing protein [unclassified Rhizobium]MDH7800053.1 DnaJ-class molecular chaperone [Rhizobium sp. AN70]
MRDPYSILGVKRDARHEDIKAAWRTKAKTVHPDANRDDPDASARFAEVGQAYDLLKDPKKRDLYDQARKAAEKKQRGETIMQQREAAREAAERARAAEKLMEELARADARNRAQTGQKADAKPETAEDIVERIFGAEAQNDPKVQQAAEAAKAAASSVRGDMPSAGEPGQPGAADDKSAPVSLAVNLFSALVRRFRPAQPAAEKAPDITAEATVTVADLLERKWITVALAEDRESRFQLEPGMTDGHVVRLKGQGLKLPGMARGDLSVTLLAARDDAFSLRGFDIHTTLPISLGDAVLGCETKIRTPLGEETVTIPAWSGSDRVLRLAGKGLADGKGEYGDLVIELRIILLEKPDEKVTDLMRHMREGLYL